MSSTDRINSDEVPPAAHQAEVHRLATEYLTCFLKLDTAKLAQLLSQFAKDRLLGLEVTDEAMVLYKNDPAAWPLQAMGVTMMTQHWQMHYEEVVRQRGGQQRQTTSPTLRGGGKRAPGW